MKKTKTIATKRAAPKSKIKNKAEVVVNGFPFFSDINNPGGFGLSGVFPQTVPGAAQLSQGDTLFQNLRWYLVSNFRQLLSQIYVEIGIVQTAVDVPVDDGFRGGIEIKSKQLSEEQIQELQVDVDREDILNSVVGRAMKWNRLYGGAGIIILVEDQDPEEPLDINSIGPDTNVQFRAVDMWELFWDKQNDEGFNMELQEQDYEFYNYYAKKLHKSRVMKLKGLEAPSFVRPRLRGWGFSIVESFVRSINQYLKATDLAFEVLDEFKVDVFKLKNLANTLLSPNGFEQIQKRARATNQQKNYNHAVVLDSEDDFLQKELSFSGLAETMAQIRMQIAADLRMPITKLFGISAAGFNSGEDDIEVYNAMVESTVRAKSKYDIIKILEIICQQKWGMMPDDLQINFKPLRMLSSEQEENVKTQKFNRLLAAKQANEIDAKAFIEACNKDNLLGVQLDPKMEILPDPDEASEVDEDKDEMDLADGDKGANKEDTQRAVAPVKTTSKGSSTLKAPSVPKTKNAVVPVERGTGFRETGVGMDVLHDDISEFEASGETDEGSHQYNDDWVVKNPGKVDEGLWAKAKDASQKAFGKIKYPFVTWWYKKQGGTFNEQKKKNSLEFDLAEYKADGGDAQFSIWHKRMVDNPGDVDHNKLQIARERSAQAFGKESWPFIVWYYKKLGGKIK